MPQTKTQLTFTVGLPTYYGAPAIVATAKSIRASVGVGEFRLIVTVDGKPLQPEIQEQLAALDAEIIFNPIRGGQTTRIKQLIQLCETDILILTQDDVLFEPTTVAELLKTFSDQPAITMIGARIKPIPAEKRFERIIEMGVRLNYVIGRRWNGGDNYLLAIGRCLAFRSQFVKRCSIPDEIINSDAYLYFENKRRGGKFICAEHAVVFNKSQQKLKEYVKQSRRFKNSFNELGKYLPNIKNEYVFPKSLAVYQLFRELLGHPLLTGGYLGLQFYVRLAPSGAVVKKEKKYWETDVSTKR